ncbi:sugar phosphate isomerase/epimerase family protein [Paenibacillus jilunlii]|uniref:2-keto-myo-inositol dehydratase n=1 Tax=Paenibacillus jilunlii TaxID=682956 RepID=A0A1G9FWP9_9BACL|nr:sugar phosphate isomerase/epimerase [Paenibacillus jilunlii]KWX71262.1 xylose isomerase [Paenibacillus jilunlii]SDK92861.1 2-keto-myo-inositol dehydratase [Paenibacillus jilunlii]
MQISVFYNHIVTACKQTGLPLPEVLGLVRGYGIQAVELDLDEVQPSPEAIKKLLEQAGMSVASMYAFCDFGNAPDVRPGLSFIDTAAYLGAGKVLVIPGFIGESADQELRERSLQHMAAALREMSEYAGCKGLIVTLEDFDDSRAPFSTSEELLWFLNEVPKLGITFDTGNFIYRGEDALEAFEKLKSRIVHVHCKDRSLEEHPGEVPKISTNGTRLFPSPVGSGCIPMQAILDRLETIGYKNMVAIEHFDAADQLAYMKQSAQWLQATFNPLQT